MVDVTDPPADIAPAPPPPAPAPARTPDNTLVTARPLGPRNIGMTLGGGYAVLLPFFVFETGMGLSRRVDLAFRFETVAGLFHYPQLAVRWAFVDLGAWTFGARLGANYSLFAVKSDKTNLTSTFYLSGELIASRPVSRASDVILALRADFDMWEYRIVEGERRATATYRYDATVVRAGMKTRLTDDLNGYVIGNIRVPIETFQYRAQEFYILPSLELGATFTF